MEQNTASTKKIGRPRAFDRDMALRSAMRTFWEHAYETTSMTDLTTAMGINAPAIYSAFGNKEALFREALQLYRGDPMVEADAIRDASSSKDAARMVLGWASGLFTGDDTPKGCLVATSLATGSAASARVRSEGRKIREGVEGHLTQRIERDVEAGVLPPETDAATLAALIVCTVQGFSTLARDGASTAKLEAIADAVLTTWP